MSSDSVTLGIEVDGADESADAINNVTNALRGLSQANVDNIGNVADDIDNLQKSAENATEPIDAMRESLDNVASQDSGNLQAISQDIDTITGSANDAVTPLDSITNSLQGLSDTDTSNLGNTSTNLQNIGQAAQGAQEPINSASQSLQTLADADTSTLSTTSQRLDALGQSAQSTVDPLGLSSDRMNTLGGMSNSANSSLGGFVGTINTSVLAFTALANGALGIVEGYTQMERAQLNVERAETRLNQARDNAEKLQNQLNQMVAAGEQGSAKYQQVSDALATTQERVRNQTDFVALAQEHANEATARFFTDIVPQGISVFSGLIQIVSDFPQTITNIQNAWSGLSGAFSAIGGAIDGLSGKFTSLKTAISTLSALGGGTLLPVAAIVGGFTAIALAANAISNNATAVHDFFEQIGNDAATILPGAKQHVTDFGDAFISSAEVLKGSINEFLSMLGLAQSDVDKWANASISAQKEMAAQFEATGHSGNAAADMVMSAWQKQAESQGKNVQQFIDGQLLSAQVVKGTTGIQIAMSNQAADNEKKNQKDLQDAYKETAKAVTDNLIKALELAKEETTGVMAGFEKFGTSGKLVADTFVSLTKSVEDWDIANMKGAASQQQIIAFGTAAYNELQPLSAIYHKIGGEDLKEFNDAHALAILAMHGSGDAATKLAPLLETITKNSISNTDATGKQAKAQSQLNDEITSGAPITGDLADRYNTLNASYAAGTTTLESYQQQLAVLNKASDAQAATIKQQQQNQEALRQTMVDSVNAATGFNNAADLSDAALKSLNTTVESAKTNITDYGAKLEDNTLKNNLAAAATQAYQGSIIQTENEISNLNKANQDSVDKYDRLLIDLTNVTAKQYEHATAVNAGHTAFLQFNKDLADTNTQNATLLSDLAAQATAWGALPGYMTPTVEGYKSLHTAVVGTETDVLNFESTVKQSWSDITAAGKTFFDGLIKAFQEGGKTGADDFKKAFDDLPAGVRAQLTSVDATALSWGASFGAEMENLGQTFAIKMQAGLDRNMSPQAATAYASNWVGSLAQGIQARYPQFASQMGVFWQALQSGQPESIAAALKLMEGMPGPISGIAHKLDETFSTTWNGLGTGSKTATDLAAQNMGYMWQAAYSIFLNFQASEKIIEGWAGSIKTAFSSVTDISKSIQTAFSATSFDSIKGALAGLEADFNETKTNIATDWQELPTLMQPAFTSISTAAQTAVSGIESAFRTMVGQIAPYLGTIASTVQTTFTNMPPQAQTAVTSIDNAFRQMPGQIAPYFGTIASTAQTTFTNMPPQATTATNSISNAFRTMVGQIAPYFGTIASTAQTTFNNMPPQAQTAVNGIDNAFRAMVGQIAPYFGTIASVAQTTFNNMVAAAQRAAATIASAFPSGQTQIQPTRPIPSGVGTANPAAFVPGSQPTVFAQHGFAGIVDKPTSFVVGEAGPEYVSVMPGGGSAQVGTQLAQGITDMAAALTKSNLQLTAHNNAITKTNTSMEDLSTRTNVAAHALAGSGLATAADTTNQSVTAMGTQSTAAGNSMNGLAANTAQAGELMGVYNNTAQQAGQANQAMGQQSLAAGQSIGVFGGLANSTGAQVGLMGQFAQGAGAQTQGMGQQSSAAGQQIGGMGQSAANTATAAERMGNYANTTSGSLQNTATAAERMGNYATTASAQTQQMGQSAAGASQSTNQLGSSAQGAAQGSSSLGQSSSSASSSVSGLGQAAQSAAQSMMSAMSRISAQGGAYGQTSYPTTGGGTGSFAPGFVPGAGYTGYQQTAYGYGPQGYTPSTTTGYNPYLYGPAYSGGYYGGYGYQSYYLPTYNPSTGTFIPAQKGFSGMIDTPTTFLAGESGSEYVSIIPSSELAGRAYSYPGGGTVGASSTTGGANLGQTSVFLNQLNDATVSNSQSFKQLTQKYDALIPILEKMLTSQTLLALEQEAQLLFWPKQSTQLQSNTTSTTTNTTAVNDQTDAFGNLFDATTSVIDGLQSVSLATQDAQNALKTSFTPTAGHYTAPPPTTGGGGLPGGGGGIPGGTGGGGVPPQFQYLLPYMQPGYVPPQFAAYAQYGNFPGPTPTSGQPGAPGVYPGPQSSQYGAFGAYAGYGQFSQGTPTSGQPGSPGVYPGASSSPQGAFGAYAQYGKFQKTAQYGFSGLVRSATSFLAGEAGPEFVSIVPSTRMPGPNIGSAISTTNTDTNSIMAMLVDLLRQIQSQSMDINLNAYLDGYNVYKSQQKYQNGRLGGYLH